MKTRKRKLKTWVKVVLVTIPFVGLYLLLGKFGGLATTSDIAANLLLVGWAMMFLGYPLALGLVTESF